MYLADNEVFVVVFVSGKLRIRCHVPFCSVC